MSALPVKFLPKTSYQIFVRTSDELYLTAVFQPRLQSPYYFLKTESLDHFPYLLFDGFFLGMLFFATLFSFLQFVQYKDKAFFWYASYIGLLFLMHWIILDLENYAVKIFHHQFSNYNKGKVPLEILMYISYTLFIHYFINEKGQYPSLTKLIKTSLGIFGFYFLFTASISLFFEIKYAWIIHYYFRIGMSILVLLLLIQLFKINNRLAKYLIFGSVSLLFFTILAPPLLSLRLKDKYLFGKDYTYFLIQAGILIELLCFSLGLGYKRYLAEQAKIKAQQENQQVTQLGVFKNQFYTNLTHEFRTPLTVILGMTDVLKSKLGHKDLATVEKPIEMIRRNGKNLLELVNQMLDLAKNESGNLVLKLKKGDVIPFTKYLSESFHSLAQAKQINLVVYSEIDHLEMDFDEDKLAIILSNLLSNAIKFTEPHGKIIIHLNRNQAEGLDYFSIKIKDNGIGISAEALPNIFNRYYQSNNLTTSPIVGTGIGLSFTKELVTLMDGTIVVNSQEGKGTEFTINIPIIQNTSNLKEVETSIQLTASFTDTYKNGLPANKKATLDLPLILIIEDNEDVAHYISHCLENQYQIIHAKNGKIGIEMAFEKIPDVIISDVMMPEKDGFEVCYILKTDERTNHIPIILLTAKVTLEDRLTGLSKGADAYLAKPFEKAELLIRIENLRQISNKLQEKIKAGLVSVKVLGDTENPITNFIQKVEKIILANVANEDFSVNELARHLHLSRSQTHRKIKALTGMSTAIYIRFIRLEKAKILLASTELSISEIAYQVGFKSPVYFSQVFKEKYGESPNTTRK